jgi:hypothetical protein
VSARGVESVDVVCGGEEKEKRTDALNHAAGLGLLLRSQIAVERTWVLFEDAPGFILQDGVKVGTELRGQTLPVVAGQVAHGDFPQIPPTATAMSKRRSLKIKGR